MGPEPLNLKLPDECDLTWAAQVHEETLRAGVLPCDVRLDASAVTRMTTIAVQLIASLAKTVSAEGYAVQITEPSPVFAAAIADLGLGEAFARMGH